MVFSPVNLNWQTLPQFLRKALGKTKITIGQYKFYPFLVKCLKRLLCGSRKYPYPPHGGSRNFLGVGGSKRDKFLKGRGVHKEFFFPEGLKCDRMNTYVFFQLIRGSQEKPKVLSVEIDVGFLVIYFLLLSRRQMTRTAPRHTSEHVRRRVKQNQSFNN